MDHAIPIFAFHRVGPRRDCRFTVPLDIFEQYLIAIEEEGYSTLTCADLVSIARGRAVPPPRACLLTFDDGCADISVYAVPLLRRHQMRGTVFVILDRLKSNGRCRPTLEDVWSHRCRMEDLYQPPDLRSINARSLDPAYFPATDHLSLEETQAMAREGICDVQSHGPDHMVHYTSDRVKTFLGPFSHWTAVAAAKGDARLGTPVYEISSTFVKPLYSDPTPLRDRLAHVVARSGGEAFFTNSGWLEILHREFEAARPRVAGGHFQSEEVWKGMVSNGLRSCIGILSAQTGNPVECLAWPFGATSRPSEEGALKAGFQLALTNQCGGFVSGMDRSRVGRISLKHHDLAKFRFALRRYSNADNIRAETARAVYDRPLDIALTTATGDTSA